MIKDIYRVLGFVAFCGAIAVAGPADVLADEYTAAELTAGSSIVTIEADNVAIGKDESYQEVLTTAPKGSVYQVVEDMGDGVVKVKVKDTYGFLSVEGCATVTPASEETIAALDAADASVDFRQGIVNYALQFVGGRYAYGGSDPHTGVDCSGFTRYVMLHAAGINLNRSSTGQASQGTPVSADQMRPGDLIFYGNGRRINHVALYIGNGQVVHSSTYKTGIKTSPWNYRAPVKIVNVIGN